MSAAGVSYSFPWEIQLMTWLQGMCGNAAVSVVSFFSAFGEEVILILLLGAFYWGWSKETGRYVGLNVLMGLIVNTLTKNIFLRRRPYFDHEKIKILRPVEPEADVYDIAAQGWSFPSGHSTNAVTAYGSLAIALRKRIPALLAVIIPLLVGFSRVAMGAHFPTDVLGGWLTGAAVIGLLHLLRTRIRNEHTLYLILMAFSLPGLFFCRSADYFSSLGLLAGFMSGTLFEEKFVKFENTSSPVRIILRTVGGALLFLALNKLLKLPFSESFLESGEYASMMVRCARYAIITFIEFALYPVTFRFFKEHSKNQHTK